MICNKGNIIISSLFALVGFIISLALLISNMGHLRIFRARNLKAEGMDKLSRDLDLYLHRFVEKIMDQDFSEIDQPEIDYFNELEFPSKEVNESMIEHHFSFQEMDCNQYYQEVNIFNLIHASLPGFNYIYSSEVVLKMLKGEIPVLLFSLLISQDISINQLEYLIKKRIFVNEYSLVGNIDLNYDLTGFLIQAFNLSTPQLSWNLIREKLNLPFGEERIDDGVYIIHGEDKIYSLFIQGDVDEIRFSCDSSSSQVIAIYQKAQKTEITYQPQMPFFNLKNGDDIQSFLMDQKMFSEIIIVNGNVFSIIQDGDYAFSKESDIILYIAKNAIIHSSLVSEPGGDRSNFTLININHNFFNGDEEVKLSIDSLRPVEIQGSIISNGLVLNQSSQLNISGQVIANNIINNGVINIKKNIGNQYLNNYFKTRELKFIYSIMVDFIGENYNED